MDKLYKYLNDIKKFNTIINNNNYVLKIGDHISRQIPHFTNMIINHHGIISDITDNKIKVIHYWGESGDWDNMIIQETDLSTFMINVDKINIYNYPMYTLKQNTVAIAKSLVGYGNFDGITNNCEKFCEYCKYNKYSEYLNQYHHICYTQYLAFSNNFYKDTFNTILYNEFDMKLDLLDTKYTGLQNYLYDPNSRIEIIFK